MSMLDPCVPKTGYLKNKLEAQVEGRDSGVATIAI